MAIMLPMFSETVATLAPLAKSENLDYFYDQGKNTLFIYRVSGSSKKECFESKDSFWGAYQISTDKRSMIFWERADKAERPLYYLDGEKGELRYMGEFLLNSQMDKTGTYLMYEEEDNSGVFKVLNLKTGKQEKKITPKISNRTSWTPYGGMFLILRSADKDEYDFIIDFSIERLSISKYYVKVESAKVFTEYDDSKLPQIDLRERFNYGAEYSGWY